MTTNSQHKAVYRMSSIPYDGYIMWYLPAVAAGVRLTDSRHCDTLLKTIASILR